MHIWYSILPWCLWCEQTISLAHAYTHHCSKHDVSRDCCTIEHMVTVVLILNCIWWQDSDPWHPSSKILMATMNIDPPKPFNFKNPDNWPRWKKRFQQFREASGLSTGSESRQVSMLLYCLGKEADNVLASTNITEEEYERFDAVLAKFRSIVRIFEVKRFGRIYIHSSHQYFTVRVSRIRILSPYTIQDQYNSNHVLNCTKITSYIVPTTMMCVCMCKANSLFTSQYIWLKNGTCYFYTHAYMHKSLPLLLCKWLLLIRYLRIKILGDV